MFNKLHLNLGLLLVTSLGVSECYSKVIHTRNAAFADFEDVARIIQKVPASQKSDSTSFQNNFQTQDAYRKSLIQKINEPVQSNNLHYQIDACNKMVDLLEEPLMGAKKMHQMLRSN
ncbi:MAG: hypothetical protein H0U27_07950 [Nitrosopumilus sp.]|nr:hypothetical protein [Nitrosopumilus sp.]